VLQALKSPGINRSSYTTRHTITEFNIVIILTSLQALKSPETTAEGMLPLVHISFT
jgi:hypothetical protein